MDVATRWPEICKATTAVIVSQLKKLFCTNGFPTTLLSDNGPQFCSAGFEAFLKHHGIGHVKSSPYHPQGNVIVERWHRTLNAIVAKTVHTKGNWPEVVPMALYFIGPTP